jgi:hypothetical protein
MMMMIITMMQDRNTYLEYIVRTVYKAEKFCQR